MRPCLSVSCCAVLALVAGCRDSLPSAPSELATGIIVYEHANFLGESAHITADISDLSSVKGPCFETDGSSPPSGPTEVWNDCISSVRERLRHVDPGQETVVARLTAL